MRAIWCRTPGCSRRPVLAQRIDLPGLIDERLKLAEHGASSGEKASTVIGSMLAGGDSIDDVVVLRAGATSSLFDSTRAPSTVGPWLRAHKWTSVRQDDAISPELLVRLWAAGAGPADLAAPLTIDVDSTIVEVQGRKKQGAAFGYTKVRGYHSSRPAPRGPRTLLALVSHMASTGPFSGSTHTSSTAPEGKDSPVTTGEVVAHGDWS